MRRAILVTAFAGLLLAPAGARAGETIQPGMRVQWPGGGCTGNFIYDGLGPRAGKTYIGLAAHCVKDRADLVVRDLAGEPFGRIVQWKWPLESLRDDWALIEIYPARLRDVDPAQRGNPEFPSGVATEADVKVYDEVRISGYGRGMATEDLQTRRTGYATFWDGVRYDLAGPILPGDSGSALVHVPTGKAFGIASAYCVPSNYLPDHTPVTCTISGPTAADAMRSMARAGFPVRMRLAGEPPPAPPADPPPPPPAPAEQPPAQPASAPAQTEPKPPAAKKKRKSARCKTRKQRRAKRCRKSRRR